MEDSVKQNWELPALTDYKGTTFQYKEIARKIAKLHILFEAAGIEKGDKIALIGRNSSNWAVVFMATLSYGAVIVPILHEFKPDTVHHIVNHCEAKLLFVGSPWYERVSVTYAIENGYDISVYGLGWKDKIPERFIKGDYIDNNELNRYYASAKIVLSDHPDDLAAMGLVINRLYDASAAGAFVISEYSPYIEEIFGDTIPMYKDKSEFKRLIDYYLAHPEERAKKAKAAREITLSGYTSNAVGRQLKQLFEEIGRSKL